MHCRGSVNSTCTQLSHACTVTSSRYISTACPPDCMLKMPKRSKRRPVGAIAGRQSSVSASPSNVSFDLTAPAGRVGPIVQSPVVHCRRRETRSARCGRPPTSRRRLPAAVGGAVAGAKVVAHAAGAFDQHAPGSSSAARRTRACRCSASRPSRTSQVHTAVAGGLEAAPACPTGNQLVVERQPARRCARNRLGCSSRNTMPPISPAGAAGMRGVAKAKVVIRPDQPFDELDVIAHARPSRDRRRRPTRLAVDAPSRRGTSPADRPASARSRCQSDRTRRRRPDVPRPASARTCDRRCET